jgi:hypothetical protein
MFSRKIGAMSAIDVLSIWPALRQIAVANHREFVTPPSRTTRGSLKDISAVTDLTGLDVSIFRALNDFCGWSPTLDRIVVHLEVLKGSLFMGIVGVLWYWPDKDMPRRRETLLAMILAVVLSLVVNRVTSMLLPYRDRIDPGHHRNVTPCFH